MDYDLRTVPREKILAFQKAMEAELDYRECVLESHEIMMRMEIRLGKTHCPLCRESFDGHTLVLCVARQRGTVHHLFQLRAKVEELKLPDPPPAPFDWWGM